MKYVLMNKNTEVLIANYDEGIKVFDKIIEIRNIEYAPLIIKKSYEMKEDFTERANVVKEEFNQRTGKMKKEIEYTSKTVRVGWKKMARRKRKKKD